MMLGGRFSGPTVTALVAILCSTQFGVVYSTARVQSPSGGEQAALPIVLFDQGHFNGQSLAKRYKPFRDVVKGDGIDIRETRATFTTESLRPARLTIDD